MASFLIRRVIRYLVQLAVVTSVTFLLACHFLKPGMRLAQRTPRPTQEEINNSLRLLGLDPQRPVILRYWDWVKGVLLHWNWGRSPDGAFINQEFGARIGVSFRLYIAATILTIIIGVALGVFAANRQYRLSDRLVTGWSYVAFILPAPLAYLLIQMLALEINTLAGHRVLYVSGIRNDIVTGLWPSVADQLQHMIVPTVALTIFGWAGYQTSQRQFLLDNLNADYVRTARATGLTKSQAVRRHALRVSFIPTAQSIAFTIPAIFTGGFFAEAVFNWPGLGLWTIHAAGAQDVMAVTATTAYLGAVFAVGAILADIATSIIDPRVRLS